MMCARKLGTIVDSSWHGSGTFRNNIFLTDNKMKIILENVKNLAFPTTTVMMRHRCRFSPRFLGDLIQTSALHVSATDGRVTTGIGEGHSRPETILRTEEDYWEDQVHTAEIIYSGILYRENCICSWTLGGGILCGYIMFECSLRKADVTLSWIFMSMSWFF